MNDESKTKEPAKKAVKTVKMHNPASGIEADVHPDEVKNYAAGGFSKGAMPETADEPEADAPASTSILDG